MRVKKKKKHDITTTKNTAPGETNPPNTNAQTGQAMGLTSLAQGPCHRLLTK